MTIKEFLQKLVECLPRSTPKESALGEYWRILEKKKFTPDALRRLFDALLEGNRFFPSVAEILETARDLELESPQPKVWRMIFDTADGHTFTRNLPLGVEAQVPEDATRVFYAHNGVAYQPGEWEKKPNTNGQSLRQSQKYDSASD